MNKENFVSIDWTKAFFGDLDQIINFVRYNKIVHRDAGTFVSDLLLRLENSKANGYFLMRKPKRKVAIKKKKS